MVTEAWVECHLLALHARKVRYEIARRLRTMLSDIFSKNRSRTNYMLSM
jgi:hypothetical protein